MKNKKTEVKRLARLPFFDTFGEAILANTIYVVDGCSLSIACCWLDSLDTSWSVQEILDLVKDAGEFSLVSIVGRKCVPYIRNISQDFLDLGKQAFFLFYLLVCEVAIYLIE